MTFKATGTYTAGNTFNIQLSNGSGVFPSTPVVIGSISNTLTSDQTVTTTIPAGTASGTGYLIRVVATAPATTSSPASAALTIVSNPTVAIAPTTAQTFLAGGSGNQLTATETPVAAGNTRVWQVSSTSGGPYTNISPSQTGLTYTPNFATPGTYYVVATSTFAACAAVTSNEVVVTVTAPPSNTINTPTFATTALCATTATPLDVTFTATGTYTAGNTFTIQLSNAAGSFAAPIAIGSISNTLTTAQTVTASIPAGTPTGTGYRIQVVSDNPAATSSGTSAALTIVSSPTVSIAPATTQTYVVGGSGSLLTATESFATGTTRVWQVSSTSGGPFANISPAQTGATYTPTFATAGTYFVRVLSTFAACAAVPSNEVEIDVTNPVPTLTSISPATGTTGATVTVTLTGTGFNSSTLVNFNGNALTPATVSATSLTVSITAPATTGIYPITVTNPAPGGGTSGAQNFTVTTGPLLTYRTAALTGSTTTLAYNTKDANISSADPLTRSAGLSAVSTSGSYVTSGFGAALDVNKYISFSYTVAPGYNTTPTEVLVGLSRSAAGATSAELRASTDASFSTFVSLGVVTTIPSQTTPNVQFPFTVPTGTLQQVTGTVYFRFYGYGSGSGNTRIGDTPSALAIIVNGTVDAGVAMPEINLVQGTTTILSSTGSYAFAATTVGNSTAATPFTIQNKGNAVLNLTGTPDLVTISGANASEFTLSQPGANIVPAGSSLPFTIAFAPTSAGAKTATISIANNDSDENPYTFTVTGTGVVAPVVTSFSPVSGPVGTLVTITGTDFTNASTVSFNGTAATVVTFNSTTSLTATVPIGATTGTITVATAYGSSTTTAIFTVTPTPTAGLLLLEDNFAYASGESLTSHGWTGYSGNSGTQVTTVSDNLTQPQYPRGFDQTTPATFAGSSTVRLIGKTTSGQDVYRPFTPSTGTATSTYAATIVKVTAAEPTDSYFMSFYNTLSGTASPDLRGRVFVQASGAGFKFGLSLGAAAASSFTSTVYSLSTQYLLVLKYDVDGTTNTNTARLYVYNAAAPDAEPAIPTLSVTGTVSSSLGTLNSIVLRQDDNDVNVDGVRVATGWGAVIGRPSYLDEVTSINAGNYYNLTVNGSTTRVTANGAILLEGTLALNGGNINTSTANSLTLTATATTSGGSATSFVNGPLARVTGTGPATTVFPVGKGTFYRPITLTSTAQVAASTYTAEQFEGNPSRTLASGNGLGTAPLARVSSKRFYTVSSSNTTTGNFTGKITLSFGAEDYVNVPSSTDFVVAKRDAASANQWTNLGRFAYTGSDSGAGGPSVAGTLTSAEFSDFSDFTLSAQNDLSNTNVLEATNPLPVELTAFSAQRQADKTVGVKWATATEKNSARFEVQRSLDGREFATVATVGAQGNSTNPTAYAAVDKAAPAAKLYYRLRQVDLDGTIAFSPVVTVGGSGEVAKVELYPNPAHSRISFITVAATPYRVLNQLGQALLRGTTEAGTASIGLDALPTGLYFLELQTATGRTVQKFEKD